MAAMKYFLILVIGLCWTQLASCGASDGIPVFGQDIPDEDFVAPETLAYDEASLKKAAKEKLANYMKNPLVQGTATTARQTAEIILTNPVSSDAIINLFHIIKDTMTNKQSLQTVRFIQNIIREILNRPDDVKDFFDNLNGWFKDPTSLKNVQRKDVLVEKCIHLTVVTHSLENLTKAIRKLHYENLPEAVETMFGNFHYLVDLNPNFRIQDVFKRGSGLFSGRKGSAAKDNSSQ